MIALNSKTKNTFFTWLMSYSDKFKFDYQIFWTLSYFLTAFVPKGVNLQRFGLQKFFFKVFKFLDFLLLGYVELRYFFSVLRLTFITKFILEFSIFLLKRMYFKFIFFVYKTPFGLIKLKKQRRIKKKIKKKMTLYLNF